MKRKQLKYRVEVETLGTITFDVEAESEGAAAKVARSRFYQGDGDWGVQEVDWPTAKAREHDTP